MTTTVEPRYEAEELVASGGMADVYRGRDRVLGRRVAIKRLRGPVDGPAGRERFIREAQLLAGFSHPNAVAVYDAFEDDRGPVIVMEYVEGRTLRAVLNAEMRLSVEQAVEIAAELLDALAAAHAHGIVHRDLKPGNILVSADGRVKLADFGIATMADAADLTATGEVVGTPKYLSPEQAVGERATPRSDIYAVGVVCYEMVCGHAPFQGDTPAATLAAHRRAPVPPLRDTCPGAPDWYVAVLERALAKDPEQRYPDAAAMRAALLAGLRDEVTVADSTLALPVVVDPGSTTTTVPKWPVAAFLALGLLVALAVWALGDDDAVPTRAPATATTVVTFPSSFTQPPATAPPPAAAPLPVPGGVTGGGTDEDAPKPEKAERPPKPEKAEKPGKGAKAPKPEKDDAVDD